VPIEEEGECIKWNLELPILSRYYNIGFGQRTVYSLLQKVTSYCRQHLKHRVPTAFKVILCDKKNNETCKLKCLSGAAILINDIWNLHIKTSLNVHSFPWREKYN